MNNSSRPADTMEPTSATTPTPRRRLLHPPRPGVATRQTSTILNNRPTAKPIERALSNGRSENGSGIVTGGDTIYEDL